MSAPASPVQAEIAPPPPRSVGDLVDVDKRILEFAIAHPAPDQELVSDTLAVSNAASTHVAFKIKTTNQRRYVVRPNVGLIPPLGTAHIFIAMHSTSNPPETGPSKDKFLLRVVEAPELDDSNVPENYWAEHEKDPAVREMIFRVQFKPMVNDNTQKNIQPPPQNPQPNSSAAEVAHNISASAPLATHPPSPITNTRDSPSSVLPASSAPSTNVPQSSQPVSLTHNSQQIDYHKLLEERNFDTAIEIARELQQSLDAKSLELARLKAQLAETKAQTQNVLKDAPKTPFSANKLLSDPFGGVSVAALGLMLLLFLILVNIIMQLF